MSQVTRERNLLGLERIRRHAASMRAVERLEHLLNQHAAENCAEANDTNTEWKLAGDALAALNDRAGLAGFTTPRKRSNLRVGSFFLILTSAIIGFAIGSSLSMSAAFFSAVVAGYCSLFFVLLSLQYLKRRQERRTLYFTPLILEELILLVESGLGLLPALQQIVAANTSNSENNPVTRVMRLVYDLASNGMPFSQALSTVANSLPQNILRHVLLHLDVSARQGAELVPALRALSSHSHTEWKLSVETRVKRLENLVVFPVFTAVIGLMFLTAAAPLVPVLELRSSLQKQKLSPHSETVTLGVANKKP